jgi:NADH-quinone oxidoreductase subunit M
VLWGEGNNIFRTTLRFFIYTFIGSLAMLASLIYLAGKSPDGWNFGYDALVSAKLSLKEALWVGSGILLAFAVKIPLMPFHSWQPDTYTEAPASGSMLLSGIMLKMGLYGLIRWFFPLVPEALHIFNPFILYAGVVGVLYGALIAIRQNDMKRIIAFSSLSHVGLIAAGMATLSSTGLKGSMVQLFSHGVNVIGLFIAVDIIQKRFSTRDLQSLGGIAKLTPAFSVLFLVLVLASTAVPFSNGFPGELLLLKAVFTKNITLGILSGLTIILCAVYMLRMYQFSMFGQAGSGVNTFENLKWYEFSSLAILAVLVLFFGLHPQTLIDISGPSIEKTIELLSNTMGVVK